MESGSEEPIDQSTLRMKRCCGRAPYQPWEFMLWLYSAVVQYLFLPTGVLITAAFGLVVTSLSVKGALLEYSGAFSLDGTNSWSLEPPVIGVAVVIMALIGLGVGVFAAIAGQGEKRKRACDDDGMVPLRYRIFALGKPTIIKVMTTVGVYAGLPLLGLFMIFVSVNQCALGLKGLSWFFRDTFSFTGVESMPDQWRPDTMEIVSGALLMVILGSIVFVVSFVINRKIHDRGCRAFPFPLPEDRRDRSDDIMLASSPIDPARFTDSGQPSTSDMDLS